MNENITSQIHVFNEWNSDLNFIICYSVLVPKVLVTTSLAFPDMYFYTLNQK